MVISSRIKQKMYFKKTCYSQLHKIHLDFEISAHKAWCREVFPSIKIQACRFHLRKCWWRKVIMLKIYYKYTHNKIITY